MAPGDIVLLYTDGLVETRDQSIDRGLDRLLASARRHGPTSELPKLAYDDLQPTGIHPDDVAVLIINFE